MCVCVCACARACVRALSWWWCSVVGDKTQASAPCAFHEAAQRLRARAHQRAPSPSRRCTARSACAPCRRTAGSPCRRRASPPARRSGPAPPRPRRPPPRSPLRGPHRVSTAARVRECSRRFMLGASVALGIVARRGALARAFWRTHRPRTPGALPLGPRPRRRARPPRLPPPPRRAQATPPCADARGSRGSRVASLLRAASRARACPRPPRASAPPPLRPARGVRHTGSARARTPRPARPALRSRTARERRSAAHGAPSASLRVGEGGGRREGDAARRLWRPWRCAGGARIWAFLVNPHFRP